MAESNIITLLVTEGDPAGIGPEVIERALEQWDRPADCRVVVLGYPAHFSGRLSSQGKFENAAELLADEPGAGIFWADAEGDAALAKAVTPGLESPSGSRAALHCIELAIEFAMHGEAHAICTAPIHKANLKRAGLVFPGHTELLAARAGADNVAMLLAIEKLKVIPATIHVPLAEVPGLLSRAALESLFELANESMRDFGIAAPSIGVAGLNPHAGEEGRFGREEIEIIAPAIANAAAQGINIRGPYPGDTIFHRALEGEFDLVIAMYHDQALIPIKTLNFHGGVNVTLGLPFVRTSPDHGTAYALAGKGEARADSMIAALQTAYELATRRAARKIEAKAS